MLHDLLTVHRAELIDRCILKAARRQGRPKLEQGVAPLLDAFTEALRTNQQTEQPPGGDVRDDAPATAVLGDVAARHGLELSRRGFPVEEVAYSYGDLCQAITDLALEYDAPIRIEEFRALNLCLDNGIADALKAFYRGRERLLEARASRALNERLGVLAHELRNHLETATLALAAMRAGQAGSAGATAAMVSSSMTRMRNLIDGSLDDVRATADLPPRFELIALADFIAEMEASASLQARSRRCSLNVAPVDPTLAVHADREMLLSAVGNLLQNAFKFTRHGTAVLLRAYARGDRVLIEVEDRCGGLPDGDVEGVFVPFTQNGADRSGIGLGLSMCRRSVAVNGGALRVRDVPGSGCVFTVDLPRHARREPALEVAPCETH